MWLPIGTDQQFGKGALDFRDAPDGFAVARADLIPDAPDIFPGLKAYAVEEGELKIVGMVASPAIAHVDHVPRLEPLQLTGHGNEAVIPVTPALVVPHDGLVALRSSLGLEHNGMAGGVRGCPVGVRNAAEGIAIGAVGSHFGHELRGG